MTGAQRIVAALVEHDVEVVFGLPGVHNLALWDALRESRVRLVGVRHEQAAAYAADGYARATGRVGVALTTTGPGAANAVAATGEAHASRSPVVVIATDIPSALRAGDRRGALHETDDQASLFAAVTAATLHGVRPREALGTALAAQRPVYLEVATDLLRSPAGPESWTPAGRPAAEPAPWAVRPAAPDAAPEADADPAELIARAERPLIWVGRLGADDGEAIGALAERIGAPVLTAYGARGVLPPDHPWLVGLPPHVPEAGRLWDEADLVLLVGDDPDGMNTQNWAMPQPPAVVAVGAERPRNYRVDAHVAAIDAHWARPHDGAFAKPGHAVEPRAQAWLDAVPGDALVLADMCIPGYWLAGFHRVAEPRGLLYPVGWGTLGWAFPASIGAALSGRGPVLSVNGDGGFLFACGELATIAQERLATTTLIWDDGGYGMLRYDQDRAGEPRFGVELHRPDFVALARSFGLRAELASEDGLGDALDRHLGDAAPSVLVVEAEALTPPPTTSPNWYRR